MCVCVCVCVCVCRFTKDETVFLTVHQQKLTQLINWEV